MSEPREEPKESGTQQVSPLTRFGYGALFTGTVTFVVAVELASRHELDTMAGAALFSGGAIMLVLGAVAVLDQRRAHAISQLSTVVHHNGRVLEAVAAQVTEVLAHDDEAMVGAPRALMRANESAAAEIGEGLAQLRARIEAGYLADMAESVELGRELERRRHDPPTK